MAHGGFYRHFASKDELVAEALRSAFDSFAEPMEQRQQQEPAAKVVADYKALYLSEQHVANPGLGCPLPAVGSDLARESDALKAEFGHGMRRFVDAVAKAKSGTAAERQQSAYREMAMMAGAVLIALASDAKTAQAVLRACRD